MEYLRRNSFDTNLSIGEELMHHDVEIRTRECVGVGEIHPSLIKQRINHWPWI